MGFAPKKLIFEKTYVEKFFWLNDYLYNENTNN